MPMRRRQLLAGLGMSIPFAGCLSTATGSESSDETPTPTPTPTSTAESGIEITAPAVSLGETTNLSINAQSVTHLRISDTPEIDATVEYENAEFSSSPSAVWQRKPPTWQWSPAENITGEIPVSISETVAPGDYQYAIAVQQKNTEEEVIQTVTITVQE